MDAPAKERVPLLWAQRWANDLVALLRPACLRIAIGGSIRRRTETVGDIELVMAPLVVEVPGPPDLFGASGEPQTLTILDEYCAALRGKGTLADRPDAHGRIAWGPKFKRALYRVDHGGAMFPVDLFSVTPPAQWGVVFLLRTGPAEWNQRLVTPRSRGGMCPEDLVFRDGALYRCDDPSQRERVRNGFIDGELVPTPEEEDVFRALGLAFVNPMDRQP